MCTDGDYNSPSTVFNMVKIDQQFLFKKVPEGVTLRGLIVSASFCISTD